VQLLKTASYDLNELYGEVYADEIDLNSFDGNNNLVGAFYQSGYLTIKHFDGEYYRLDFPNRRWRRVSPNSLSLIMWASRMQGRGGSSNGS
jgi:hypothetical protein